MNEKLQKLESIINLVQESVSRTEFVDAFKVVVSQIKELRKSNETEWTLVNSAVQMLQKKLEDDNAIDLKEIRTEITSICMKMVTQMEKEYQAKMAEIDAKLASITSGEDGEDAVVDEQKIIAEVLKLIPPDVEETGDEIIQKINKADLFIAPSAIEGLDELLNQIRDVKPGSKVGWGAHPISVAQSGTTKTKLVRRLNFTGATVTHNPDGTTTVAVTGGAGNTFYTETPSGLINGSNKVYTVLHSITSVLNFSINGSYIHPSDYTAVGTTITFVTALDASLAGLPFTIVYA